MGACPSTARYVSTAMSTAREAAGSGSTCAEGAGRPRTGVSGGPCTYLGSRSSADRRVPSAACCRVPSAAGREGDAVPFTSSVIRRTVASSQVPRTVIDLPSAVKVTAGAAGRVVRQAA